MSKRAAARKPSVRTRAPRPRHPTKAWSAALDRGRDQARVVLAERRRRARKRSAVAGTGGLLVAEGDSWFDYPFFDVLEELEEAFAYEIESVAHKGDTLEEMVYDPNQLDKLARKLQRLRERERTPRAILLSAGGNDIAGDEFAVLLNHKGSGLPALNDQVVNGVLGSRLRQAMISLLGAVTHLCEQAFKARLPILLHGYDYPVPDGRGYLGGFWMLPGPWLEPGFRRKGFTDLRERCAVMETLIDRYNTVLASVAGGPGLEHVRHLDLRGTLSNELAATAYKKTWGDELHPTEGGFRSVAGRFDKVLRAL